MGPIVRADGSRLRQMKTLTCPGCGRDYDAEKLATGSKVRCKACNESFQVTDTKVEVSPEPRAPGKLKPDSIEGYRIEAKIGHGGMGTVYRAIQLSLDRPVAIKVLSSELVEDDKYVQRFLSEAKSTGKLRHDNIVSAIDFGKVGDSYYLVMEHVDGTTLSRRLRKDKVISEMEALRLIRQVIEGLEHARSEGFLHRDVKPANIMLAGKGRVKICDLGLSRSIGKPDVRLTKPGNVLCSPGYASPEQLRDGKLDHRSDIYSLGITLYEMLTGSIPFRGENAADIAVLQATKPLKPPRDVNPKISEGTNRLILKMLAKRPENRPSSYSQILKSVDRILDGPDVTIIRPAPPPKKRIPAGLIGSAAAAVVLIGLLFVLSKNSSPPHTNGENHAIGNGTEPPDGNVPPLANPGGDGNPVDPPAVPELKRDRRDKLDHHVAVLKRDWRDKLDHHVAVLNFTAITAAYLDAKERYVKSAEEKEKALKAVAELRSSMRTRQVEVAEFVVRIKASRPKAFIPFHLRHEDRILHFENYELSKISADRATRLLGKWVAGFAAGSRARVVFRRGEDVREEILRFDLRPKEILTLIQVADLIPGQGAPAVKEAPPTGPKTADPLKKALGILRSPKAWAVDADREEARKFFQGQAATSDVSRAYSIFLEKPEDSDALQKYFDAAGPEPDHLKMVERLAKADAVPLKLFAAAHLSDAVRANANVEKAAGRLGYRRSGSMWGEPNALSVHAASRHWADQSDAEPPKKRFGTERDWTTRYISLMLRIRTAVGARDWLKPIYLDVRKFTKKARGRKKKHLQAIEAALKKVGTCTKCDRHGYLKCPECGGEGIITKSCTECKGVGRVRVPIVGGEKTVTCPKCRGIRKVWMEKCAKKIRCDQCEKTKWKKKLDKKVKLGDILAEETCPTCGGAGSRFTHVAWLCSRCDGFGVRLVPADAPDATLW